MKHSQAGARVYDARIILDKLLQTRRAELGWLVRYPRILPGNEVLGHLDMSCKPRAFDESLALALFDHLWDLYPDRRGRVLYYVGGDYAAEVAIWNGNRSMFVGFSVTDIVIDKTYYDDLASARVGPKRSVALEGPGSLDQIEHEFQKHGWPVDLEEAWRQTLHQLFQ